MSQMDSYLKRVFSEYNLNYFDDLYDMYSFVTNEHFRKILAAFHTNLNKWFTTINDDIRTKYEEGKIVYDGGYLHAQDSREYLALIEKMDTLRGKLGSSEYAFKLCNDEYGDYIRRTKRFVKKYGGSTIPEGFEPIEIEELNPVFELVAGVSVESVNKKTYADLKSVGEGSYAHVFSYIDPNYNIPVILKRALPTLDNKEMLRFKQEFQILKSLHSPYIVEVYGYNDMANEYTMEYMDETIYKYILRENSKLTLKERKNII